MLKKITSIILFTFLLISASKAEMVSKIVIEGNKRISDETVKVYGDIQLNKDLSEGDVNKIINIL